MFCADCSSILFEVINTHSLISCTMLYSLSWWVSVLFFFFFFNVSIYFFLGGTITDVQLWLSVSDDVFLPSVLVSGWTAPRVQSVTTRLLLIPRRIYLSFYTTTCNAGEDPPYVKVRHDHHLYTYSFTITVCLLWHAENDTVNMTYSSLRYVC